MLYNSSAVSLDIFHRRSYTCFSFISVKLHRNLRIFVLILACVVLLRTVDAGRGCNNSEFKCFNGDCISEESDRSKSDDDSRMTTDNKTPKMTCKCDDHWSGPSCDIFTCSGRMALPATEGIITDGTGNYSTDNKCTWLVGNNSTDKPIRLRIDEFATECGWDHLYVYDGSSVDAPLIAVLSGLMEKPLPRVLPDIIARSGYAYLHFYSDAAYNMTGFVIRYTHSNCAQNCSRHGECLSNGTCKCNHGWTGPGCMDRTCPNKNCSTPNGSCDNNKCLCNSGFRGADCSIPDYKGVWDTVVDSDYLSSFPRPVASHSSVVFQDSSLWIVGGYSFQTTDNKIKIQRYSFVSKQWDELPVVESTHYPLPRYGHAAELHNDNLYMFGGVVQNTVSNELWMLHSGTLKWHPVLAKDSTKILATAGHTAHAIGDGLFIFFGHNPIYGFLNTVQYYNFNDKLWTVLNTTGAIVKGMFGHSSVYDPVTNKVLVHGGYSSESSAVYFLSDSLFEFDPVKFSWRILRGSNQNRYLHSAAILGRFMFVFGGNAHNDTSFSQGAKCYSSNFLAYDIDCDKWYTLDDPLLPRNVARFGHSADVYNGNIYIFGGFNGLLYNDLLRYQPGKCVGLNDNCLSSAQGTKCVLLNNGLCVTPETAQQLQRYKTIKEKQMSHPMCDPNPEGPCDTNRYETCLSCTVNSASCIWCNDACQLSSLKCSVSMAVNESQCLTNSLSKSLPCGNLHNCYACGLDDRCVWNNRERKCEVLATGVQVSNRTCDQQACHVHSTCENCTKNRCMWCGNQERCFESNSYVTSFLYGQCIEWTTNLAKCKATRCSDLQTCAECQQNPSCGFCDDGSDTGLGRCMKGSLIGPDSKSNQTCPAQLWNFASCPACQCNGHSNCSVNSSTCISCIDYTSGDHCEECQEGFWGRPAVGGNCTKCECNNQANSCNQENGSCYCRTRGVIGDHCQECDKAHKYLGSPTSGGTCYYELGINWIFTFNLTKEESKYHTRMNFLNTPPTKDKDVDLNINCSSNASMNISVKRGNEEHEKFIHVDKACRLFSTRFLHKEYNFGDDQNTTFYVYVFNFQTPFVLQMYFSPSDTLDLFRFFVIFFSCFFCFFSLLLIAFVAWKLKQRYDMYRRGQRHAQEMAQMASRPFGSFLLEVEQSNCTPTIIPEKTDVKASLT